MTNELREAFGWPAKLAKQEPLPAKTTATTASDENNARRVSAGPRLDEPLFHHNRDRNDLDDEYVDYAIHPIPWKTSLCAIKQNSKSVQGIFSSFLSTFLSIYLSLCLSFSLSFSLLQNME